MTHLLKLDHMKVYIGKPVNLEELKSFLGQDRIKLGETLLKQNVPDEYLVIAMSKNMFKQALKVVPEHVFKSR